MFKSAFLILGYLSLKIPTLSQTTHLQECLTAVLNQGTRMTFASLGAFAISQTMDVISFHWLKNKTNGKYKWLRNNASTMSSQLIDTVIFITIAFYGVVDNIILMIFAQYLIKLILAALDTPFFLFLHKTKKMQKIKERIIGRCLRWHECLMKKQRKQRLCIMTV